MCHIVAHRLAGTCQTLSTSTLTGQDGGRYDLADEEHERDGHDDGEVARHEVVEEDGQRLSGRGVPQHECHQQ